MASSLVDMPGTRSVTLWGSGAVAAHDVSKNATEGIRYLWFDIALVLEANYLLADRTPERRRVKSSSSKEPEADTRGGTGQSFAQSSDKPAELSKIRDAATLLHPPSTSSAIPHQADRRRGPARAETTSVPSTAKKAWFAVKVTAATIPIAWRVIANSRLRRWMIPRQESIAVPVAVNMPLAVHRCGNCYDWQRQRHSNRKRTFVQRQFASPKLRTCCANW